MSKAILALLLLFAFAADAQTLGPNQVGGCAGLCGAAGKFVAPQHITNDAGVILTNDAGSTQLVAQ